MFFNWIRRICRVAHAWTRTTHAQTTVMITAVLGLVLMFGPQFPSVERNMMWGVAITTFIFLMLYLIGTSEEKLNRLVFYMYLFELGLVATAETIRHDGHICLVMFVFVSAIWLLNAVIEVCLGLDQTPPTLVR